MKLSQEQIQGITSTLSTLLEIKREKSLKRFDAVLDIVYSKDVEREYKIRNLDNSPIIGRNQEYSWEIQEIEELFSRIERFLCNNLLNEEKTSEDRKKELPTETLEKSINIGKYETKNFLNLATETTKNFLSWNDKLWVEKKSEDTDVSTLIFNGRVWVEKKSEDTTEPTLLFNGRSWVEKKVTVDTDVSTLIYDGRSWEEKESEDNTEPTLNYNGRVWVEKKSEVTYNGTEC